MMGVDQRMMHDLRKVFVAQFGRGELNQLVQFQTDAGLGWFVAPGTTYPEVVDKLLKAANRAGWLTGLVEEALRHGGGRRPQADAGAGHKPRLSAVPQSLRSPGVSSHSAK